MDWEVASNESVSMAVVKVVSMAEQRDPTSLPPLTNAVDPNALNNLFAPGASDGQSRTGNVSFVYSDSHVSVDHNEYITVEPATEFSPM